MNTDKDGKQAGTENIKTLSIASTRSIKYVTVVQSNHWSTEVRSTQQPSKYSASCISI